MNVSDVGRVSGPGLSPDQLDRLAQLERRPKITSWQAGEARALSLRGTPDERERALAVLRKERR